MTADIAVSGKVTPAEPSDPVFTRALPNQPSHIVNNIGTSSATLEGGRGPRMAMIQGCRRAGWRERRAMSTVFNR